MSFKAILLSIHIIQNVVPLSLESLGKWCLYHPKATRIKSFPDFFQIQHLVTFSTFLVASQSENVQKSLSAPSSLATNVCLAYNLHLAATSNVPDRTGAKPAVPAEPSNTSQPVSRAIRAVRPNEPTEPYDQESQPSQPCHMSRTTRRASVPAVPARPYALPHTQPSRRAGW